MYNPPHFAVEDPATIAEMVDRAGLAILATAGESGLFASHLPILFEEGRFIGHLARRNPHRGLAGDGEALLILPGPDGYVSPAWYPSKAEHGREVPTWNYEAVHVYGRLTWTEDPAQLLSIVTRLTERHERGRAEPWSVADAPAGYVDGMLRAIVGLELVPTRIEAKRKLSQNRKPEDRVAVAEGLEAGSPALAALVRNASTAAGN